MKIAVVNLTGGDLSGGYRKYLQQLTPLLAAHAAVQQLDVFLPPGVQLANVEAQHWPAGDVMRGYQVLRQRLQQLEPDVVFIPTARRLDCGKTPVVTMVRNMEPLVTPFSGHGVVARAKNVARAYLAWRACRRANRIIAVSNFVRDFLTNKWRIDPSKIGIVYHGVEAPVDRSAAVRPQTLQSLPQPHFLFTAGSIRPARGLTDMIRALAMLQHDDPQLQLVIAGRPDPGTVAHQQKLQQMARELGVDRQVIWAGQLNRLEMSWCYYHCALFIMTSRTEACPNIALEAMSHGALCIANNSDPLPEFFGDTAEYYVRGDAHGLAGTIERLLLLPAAERQMRRDQTRRRIAHMTWSKTATNTIVQLASVIEDAATGVLATRINSAS